MKQGLTIKDISNEKMKWGQQAGLKKLFEKSNDAGEGAHRLKLHSNSSCKGHLQFQQKSYRFDMQILKMDEFFWFIIGHG